MIKFFRKIRYNLMETGKTGKYFKYAIGEIILVMVGILLALQVNNWNNERSSRQLEVKYLRGLKADLEYNLASIKIFKEEREIKYTSAMSVLEMDAPSGATKLIEMDSIIWQVFVWQKFSPRTNTMDELIGSGYLSLIQNDSIKAMVQNIQKSYEMLDERTEHMRREYDFYLYDRSAALRELSPFVDLKKSVEMNVLMRDQVKMDDEIQVLQNQAQALLNDLTFRNGLKFAIFNNNGLHTWSIKLEEDMQRLIDDLDSEINK